MENLKQQLANKSFDEIISDGFHLFKKSYSKLILPLAFFSIISIITKILLFSSLNWSLSQILSQTDAFMVKMISDPSYFPTNTELASLIQSFGLLFLVVFLEMLIDVIFTIIVICSVASFLYKKYMQKDVDFSREFKKAFNPKMLSVLLLLGIFTTFGVFLIFIPSIIIVAYYLFYVFTYNDPESKNAKSEARSISRGAFWRIIGIFIICAIIELIVDFIYTSILDFTLVISAETYNGWLDPNTRNYGMLILYHLIYNLHLILLTPVFVCLLTPLYASHKARFEIGYNYQRSQYSQWNSQIQSPPLSIRASQEPKQPESYAKIGSKGKTGFYCPFCGYYIRDKQKFCISCGESLDFKV